MGRKQINKNGGLVLVATIWGVIGYYAATSVVGVLSHIPSITDDNIKGKRE